MSMNNQPQQRCSDDALIDFSEFLLKRPEPPNANCVTGNDIKIAVICALASKPAKWQRYAKIWSRAFFFLKLKETRENQDIFYARLKALSNQMESEGIIIVNRECKWHSIRLVGDYLGALRRAVNLYDECK